MKKVFSVFFTVFIIVITLLSCLVSASAELATGPVVFEENSVTAVTENITASTEFSDATGGVETTVPETTVAEATTAETTAVVEQPSTTQAAEGLIAAGKGLVAFSLSDVTVDVTITIVDKNNKEYNLDFTSAENYIVQISLPVGEYTIKSVETKLDDYKIKDCHIVDSDKTSFTITETDFISIKFTATEKKELFIVGFLKREWYLLVILLGLLIAYWYKRTHRILPSQES